MNRPRVVYFPSGVLVYFSSGARRRPLQALNATVVIVAGVNPERRGTCRIL